ncbi:MAG: hypothetical protein CMN29_18435 [Sandaracinus sp.]|nr:hypothetical protein [Sandaracinus sp.]
MHRHTLIGALALLAFGAGTARAELPEGVFYNDFDAYFELENTEESRNGQRVDAGWYLEFDATLVGDEIPVDSGLKYVLKQGRRTLATVLCDARLRQRHTGYDYEEGVPGLMEGRGCEDDDETTQATGEITIEVYFIDGNDDSETLVRTHTIEVRKFARVRRASQYYIVHNGEILSAVIHEFRRSERNATNARNMRNDYVGLFLWMAEQDSNGVRPDGPDLGNDLRVRCSVDGERIPTTFDPRVNHVRDRRVDVMASWGEGRQDERDRYAFEQFHIVLPITMGEDSQLPGAARLEEHPGQWECELRQQRETIRTIRFTVADGHIQPHPEEAAEGGVQLPERLHLVDMRLPRESPIETRVDGRAARRGPFFGVGWHTDEGRAMVRALPRIGEAFLPGERRRRGRRGRRGRRR